MAKELRKFLFKFPYLPRPRIMKEGVEVPSWVNDSIIFLPLFFLGVAGPSPSLLSILVAEPFFFLGDLVVAGF